MDKMYKKAEEEDNNKKDWFNYYYITLVYMILDKTMTSINIVISFKLIYIKLSVLQLFNIIIQF